MSEVNGPVLILIIDDDPETTEILKLLLEQSQFEVITANSGAIGIGLANETNPDVIMVDLLVPEINGLAVSEEV